MTLKELRRQSGKTAKEVADKLGVSNSAISHYECGMREMKLEHVLILAQLYDCAEREVIEAQLNSIAIRSSD